MGLNKNTPRFLGIAFLVQFVGSLLSGTLSGLILETGTISEKLVNISNNTTLFRLCIFLDLITSIAIIAMAVLLYIVLQKQNKILALVALSWWLTEAIILAISRIWALGLLELSLDYVQTGVTDPSYFLTLGSVMYESIQFGFALHMLFFTVGGPLWYYMFYKSEAIPRGLALWGLVLFPLMAISITLDILGVTLDDTLKLIIFVPYIPFEAVMGIWFLVKGIKDYD
ncbi:MAG: DUF4386 domain-containing protein [Candidatus Thorarchaeota archaeon]